MAMDNNGIDPLSAAVARRLSELAGQAGLTQTELARQSGVSQAQISRIFRLRRTVSIEDLDMIARALDTLASAILEHVEDELYGPIATVEPIRLTTPPEGIELMAAHDPGYLPEDEQEQTREP